MNKTTIVNGLTKDDIVLLYRYVNAYEKHLKDLNNNSTIKTQEEQLSRLKKSFVYQIRKQKELENNLQLDLKNQVYFTQSKGNKTLSFLFHLRNSIAHCLIEKMGKQYKLTDKNRNKKLSMVGSIDCDILENIIKLFI